MTCTFEQPILSEESSHICICAFLLKSCTITCIYIITQKIICSRSGDQGSVSLSAFAYLYSELVQYHQSRVSSISELERRLEAAGFGVGLKTIELAAFRSREVRYFRLITSRGFVLSSQFLIPFPIYCT